MGSSAQERLRLRHTLSKILANSMLRTSICLPFPMFRVMSSEFKKLCFTRSALSEAVLERIKYLVFFRHGSLSSVYYDVAGDNVLYELAADAGKGDGAIVFWFVYAAFFVDWGGFLPVIRYGLVFKDRVKMVVRIGAMSVVIVAHLSTKC